MKKIIALLLAAMMVFALCACGGGSAAPEAPAAEAPAAEAPAAPAEPAAPAPEAPAPAAEGDDFEEWKAYLAEYAVNGAPDPAEGQEVADAILASATVDDVMAVPQTTVFFSGIGALEFDAWVAAGKPAADIANMGSPTGEPSGEPTEEPAA